MAQQIEQAIEQLSADELANFRAWFAEYDAAAWDRQLEADVHGGRLDRFMDEALADLDQPGVCR